MTHYRPYATQESGDHEQVIYDHWLDCVRNETPQKLLNRFHSLFILGQSYPNISIRDSLAQLVMSERDPQTLLPFLNRCCYILINQWQMNPTDKTAIVELVALIEQVQTPGGPHLYDRATRRLRSLIYAFTQSKYFVQLRRIAQFVREKEQASRHEPLVALIGRYPYLYSHCLKNSEDNTAYKQSIYQAQKQAQKKFETDLSRYIALSTLQKGRDPFTNEETLKNPTLLSTQDLHGSLKHFVGPSTCHGTYREMSSGFIRTVDQRMKFQSFKDNLYDYLTADIDPKYGDRRFNQNLRKFLNTISPEYHRQPMTDILKTRTYNRLLNHLVIESRQTPKHIVFMDLITNLGTTRTVGLLLKLVLLARPVKDSLERRLGILFQHYESHQQSSIQWLVRCLEKVNLALTTHFGKLNVSYLAML